MLFFGGLFTCGCNTYLVVCSPDGYHSLVVVILGPVYSGPATVVSGQLTTDGTQHGSLLLQQLWALCLTPLQDTHLDTVGLGETNTVEETHSPFVKEVLLTRGTISENRSPHRHKLATVILRDTSYCTVCY